ncbi:hypothetical protein BJ684DRAFT_20025 [Piptocephalis cylindrospora]|uniref:Lung seven transmembrane receptor-domain-containing protein n=1 Tax=Piptocephalis cylindrospora TaxID=1907219 RepID=A0A4P9Y5M2_9FUNG|nr:hypothetical protein BJ684DRAFT_20025 [Piptocephalis cylindrospora]|eukprot:RKP13491.1 hypothetical protein BJ684DRAFT_20025 [Piptocephalis cylindrospora]
MLFNLLSRLPTLLVGLSSLTTAANAAFTYTIRGQEVNVPTADYFQANFGDYSFPNSLLVSMRSTNDRAAPCTFQSARANETATGQGGVFNSTGGFYDHSIVLFDTADALAVGCQTVKQMSLAAERFAQDFSLAGYPPLAAIIAISKYETGVPAGGPMTEDYPSRDAKIGDGPPSLPLAFVNPTLVRDLKGSSQRYISVALTREKGQWNDKFLDPGYIAWTWILFAINVLLCLYGLYRFISLILHGRFKRDARTTIFILGLISTALASAVIVLPVMRQKTYVISQFSTMIYNVAFYLLLLLWSGVLSRIQMDRSFGPFRLVIYFAIASALMNGIIGLVQDFSRSQTNVIKAYQVMVYWTPAIEALAAILFLVYSVRFAVRMSEYTVTREVRRALGRLTKLSVIGFIAFAIMAVNNILINVIDIDLTVTNFVGITVSNNIGLTLRAIGIIYILNVSLPSDYSTHSGSSSGKKGSTGWSGWSRGWRRALYGEPTRGTASHGVSGHTQGTASAEVSSPKSPKSPGFFSETESEAGLGEKRYPTLPS